MSIDTPDPTLEDDLVALLEDLAEHRETLVRLMDTAKDLEQSGVLDLLQVIGTRDVASGEQLYETFAENPEDLQAIQNLSLLAGGVSRVNPDTLAAFIDGIEEGPSVSREMIADPPEIGILGALRQLQDQDVRRGLGVIFVFLKAIGTRSDTE